MAKTLELTFYRSGEPVVEAYPVDADTFVEAYASDQRFTVTLYKLLPNPSPREWEDSHTRQPIAGWTGATYFVVKADDAVPSAPSVAEFAPAA